MKYLLRVHEADDTHLPLEHVRQESHDSEIVTSDDEDDHPAPEKVEQNLKDPKCQVSIVQIDIMQFTMCYKIYSLFTGASFWKVTRNTQTADNKGALFSPNSLVLEAKCMNIRG